MSNLIYQPRESYNKDKTRMRDLTDVIQVYGKRDQKKKGESAKTNEVKK